MNLKLNKKSALHAKPLFCQQLSLIGQTTTENNCCEGKRDQQNPDFAFDRSPQDEDSCNHKKMILVSCE